MPRMYSEDKRAFEMMSWARAEADQKMYEAELAQAKEDAAKAAKAAKAADEADEADGWVTVTKKKK